MYIYIHIFSKISEKLNNPNTSIKCYRSLIKALLNGKRVPCSSICDNNRYVTNFKEKFSISIRTLPYTCSKHTNNILDALVFSKEDM